MGTDTEGGRAMGTDTEGGRAMGSDTEGEEGACRGEGCAGQPEWPTIVVETRLTRLMNHPLLF